MAPGRRRRDDVASITIVAIFVYIYYIVELESYRAFAASTSALSIKIHRDFSNQTATVPP
jgi:hypothetical protein